MLAQLKHYKLMLSSVAGIDTPLVRWGVLIVVVIVFWSVVYEPFLSWKEDRLELLASRVVEQDKLNVLKRSGSDWQQAKQLYQLQFSKHAQKCFQQSAMVSLGKVQQIVSGLAKQNHLKLVAQKTYDAIAQPDLGMRLPASFTLMGRTDDITYFIAAIAVYPKLLVVDDMRINRQLQGNAQLVMRLNGYMLETQGE